MARPVKPRADAGEDWPMYLGIAAMLTFAQGRDVTDLRYGNAHAVGEPEQSTDEPPSIWLPLHRSGSRFGGWRKQSLAASPRTIGFRPPR